MAAGIWVLAFLSCVLSSAHGSHFRGGLITWKPQPDNPSNLDIDFRMSWRRTYYNCMCNQSIIDSGQLIGEGLLSCVSGCRGSVGSLMVRCTDYSLSEDWSTGTNSLTASFGAGTQVTLRFSSCCWISRLVAGAGSMSMLMTLDLRTRADIGIINSSPITSMPPIVRLQQGCDHVIRIPVTDANGDVVRCRWSSGSAECGGVCGAFVGATLNGEDCTVEFKTPASYTDGWYAVALQIEDFASSQDKVPLSSIPLQFLVHVFPSTEACDGSQPEFVGETPEDADRVVVLLEQQYQAKLVAAVSSPVKRITQIQTVSPQGMTRTDVRRYPGSNVRYYVDIEWNPTIKQTGSHILCFTATDNRGLNSDQRCVTLVVGVDPATVPSITNVAPRGEVAPDQAMWTVTFDKEFMRPRTPTLVKFIESTSGTVVYTIDVSSSLDAVYPAGSQGKDLVLRTRHQFQPDQSYHVLLDQGVALSVTVQDVPSAAVTDPTFWTFDVRDDPCRSDPCGHGGRCTRGEGQEYSCTWCEEYLHGGVCPEVPVDCSSCRFSNGLGFRVDPSNCQCYYSCVAQGDGNYIMRERQCCDNGLLWNPEVLSCDWAENVAPQDCDLPTEPQPPRSTVPPGDNRPCPYRAHSSDPSKYILTVDGQEVILSCPAGLTWNQDVCVCTGDDYAGSECDQNGPLLYFPFDDHFNDVKCNHAHSDVYGHVILSWDAKKGRSAYFDGSSRLTVEFLNNWFAGKEISEWSVTLWVKMSGPPGGVYGLVSYGDCENDHPFTLYLKNGGRLGGSVYTLSQETSSDLQEPLGAYKWNHAALVYNGVHLSLFLNGNKVKDVPADGFLRNAQCPLAIGHVEAPGRNGFLKGFLDEVRVYQRALSTSDIASLYQSP